MPTLTISRDPVLTQPSSPFPDRFEENLRSTDGRVKSLFKSKAAKLISTIFIRLHNPDEEAFDHRISVILAVRTDHLSDPQKRSEIDSFEERLIDVFANRPFIVFECDDGENPDVRVMSEDDLTLGILRQYQRYDVDYRSLDDDTNSPPVNFDQE